MKKFKAKLRRIRMTRWNKLTLGEKVLITAVSLVKYALIAAVVAMVVGAVVSVIAGALIAFAIANAIAGGLMDASRAYRPGDRYVRF